MWDDVSHADNTKTLGRGAFGRAALAVVTYEMLQKPGVRVCWQRHAGQSGSGERSCGHPPLRALTYASLQRSLWMMSYLPCGTNTSPGCGYSLTNASGEDGAELETQERQLIKRFCLLYIITDIDSLLKALCCIPASETSPVVVGFVPLHPDS